MKRLSRYPFLALCLTICTLLIASLTLPVSDAKAEEKRTYTIATDVTFAPFEFQDVNGEFVGIDMDLIKPLPRTRDLILK